MRLILASGSPYRQILLARLLIPFEISIPDVNETAQLAEDAAATALRLAQLKAAAVADRFPNAVVIGSDQVASLDGEHIGKPGSHENALSQLKKMQGRKVVFQTALCVHDGRQGESDRLQLACVQTEVTFSNLCDTQLDAYLRIEQPYDCAGSAKNEGLGIALIEQCVSSDPTALIGLPLIALCGMLRKIGAELFARPSA